MRPGWLAAVALAAMAWAAPDPAAAQAAPPTTSTTAVGSPTPAPVDGAAPCAPTNGSAPACATGLDVPWIFTGGTTGTASTPPATPGSGLDGLLRAPPHLRDDRAEPTFYERYGAGGYTLDVGVRDGAGGVGGIAAALWASALWVVDAALKSFQWAYAAELFGWLGGSVERIVHALRETVFDGFVGVFLALAACYVAYHGLARRRSALAAEGMTWTVLSLAMALAFLAQPRPLLDGLNDLTTGVARESLAAMETISPDPDLGDGIVDRAGYGDDAVDAELRRAADRLWRTTAYVPWAILSFGSLDVARDVAPGQTLTYGERLLEARTFSGPELARLRAGEVSYDELRGEKLVQLAALRDDLGRLHAEAVPWLNGERGSERLAIAGLALVAAFVFGGFVLLLAGAVLVTQLALLVLAATAPVFLVVGILPGRGRLVTMRWIELALSMAIKRAVIGIVLSVVLVLSTVLIGSTVRLGWGITVAMQIGLVGAVVVYRSAFSTLLTSATAPTAAVVALTEPSSRPSLARRLHVSEGAPRRPASRRTPAATAPASPRVGRVSSLSDVVGLPRGRRRTTAEAAVAGRNGHGPPAD